MIPNVRTTTFLQASTVGHLPCDHILLLSPPGAKQETKQDGLWITDHWPCPVISDYFQFSEKNIKMFPVDYETSSCFDMYTLMKPS